MRAVWQEVPLGWKHAPQVAALASLLRRKDVRLLLLDLWEWAKVYDRVVTGPAPEAAIENGAGWTGKRGAFVAAAVECGWLERREDGYRIRSWREVIRVQYGTAVVEEADADEARRAAERKKKQAQRSRRKADKAGDIRGTTSGHDGDTAGDATGTEGGHGGDKGDKNPSNARARTHTDTHTNTRHQHEQGEGHSREGQPDSTPDASPVEQAVTEVLEHWRDVVWVPTGGSPDAPIDEKRAKNRRKVVRGLLGDGWTVERLKAVCDGVSRDDWLMGRDPKAKAGGWTEVENVFRRSKLEAREKAAAAPRAGPTRLSAQVYEDHNVEDLFREVSP